MTTTDQQTSAPALSAGMIRAWQQLLRANCVAMRTLDTELQAEHDMTLSDYDVLVQLRDADDHFLRMSELSRRTLLTRSGMTRLVQGLERDNLVERMACDTDARVSYAKITDVGLVRLAEARVTHHAGIRRVFADKLSEDEAEQLGELLSRIGDAEGDDTDACCGSSGA